ncbi:NAD-dependent epimerase/dehydratase family protein [Candidatus Gottesmanbacteria bacterium]|nr:NAD-dependent epimerase/dehydratase family protein [Candidatus Gottesmanbacteria bacterium]
MKRQRVLITGGAGFLGTHLTQYLLQKNTGELVIFDKLERHTPVFHTGEVTYFKGNILSEEDVTRAFSQYGPFTTVYHLAGAMPNKEVPDDLLWKTNVLGTKSLVKKAIESKTKSFVFTSSNVAYGIPKQLPVTITGVGRLGLQAILFEFISENKNVYVLGGGLNRYQFVDVMDMADALEKASHIHGFDVYTIGADGVLPLREIYQKVIAYAGSTSKIVSFPKTLSFMILTILDKLNISPLGIYQYTMIGRSLYADTTKAKTRLNWHPKKTNADTFIENYEWYKGNKGTFVEIGSGSASSNKSLPKMGIFWLLKLLS